MQRFPRSLSQCDPLGGLHPDQPDDDAGPHRQVLRLHGPELQRQRGRLSRLRHGQRRAHLDDRCPAAFRRRRHEPHERPVRDLLGPRLQGHPQRQHVPQGQPRAEHALHARRPPRRTAPQPPLGRSLRPARVVPVGPAAEVRRTRYGRPPAGVSHSARTRARLGDVARGDARPALRAEHLRRVRGADLARLRFGLQVPADRAPRFPGAERRRPPGDGRPELGPPRRHQHRGHQGAGLPHVGQPALQSRRRCGTLAKGRRICQGGDGFQNDGGQRFRRFLRRPAGRLVRPQ